MNHGYIALHRKIFDNPISKKPNYFSVWLYIILKANHEDGYLIICNEKTLIRRGEFLGSMQNISEHFGLSISSISKILNYLEKEQMVKTKRTNKFTIFQVINYDSYQQSENNEKTTRKQKETNNNNNNNNNNNSFIGSVSPKPKNPKGTRFDVWLKTQDEQQITQEWGQWCFDNTGWEAQRVECEMLKFLDYWKAKTGQGAIKLDWHATWRNWIRNAMKYDERNER